MKSPQKAKKPSCSSEAIEPRVTRSSSISSEKIHTSTSVATTKKLPKKSVQDKIESQTQIQGQTQSQAQTQSISVPTTATFIPSQISTTVTMADSVRVPFPSFKSDDIESWFRRLEYWFEFSKVATEQAKFALIASQIDDSTVANLEEMLNPDKETPYAIIKAKIISIFQATTSSKINKLLSGCQLGDLKPSQLLAEMKRIGGNVGDDILRNLWSKRLPLHLQPVVAAATQSSLSELATIADAVIDVVGPIGALSVNAMASNANDTQTTVTQKSRSSEFEELRAAIHQLTETVSKMQTNDNKRSRSRSRSRSRPRGNQAGENGTFKLREDRICYYHRRFGNKAKLCTKPCTFEESTSDEPKN